MSIASGTVIPVHLLLFGEIINEFVFYDQVVTLPFNETLVASENCRFFVQNGDIQLPTPPPIDGEAFFCPNASVGTSILNRVCDPEGIFLEEINEFAYIYVGIATAVFIVVFISNWFWNISAYRQTRRIREAFYRSILRQEIGWFDVNETTQLSTRLSE